MPYLFRNKLTLSFWSCLLLLKLISSNPASAESPPQISASKGSTNTVTLTISTPKFRTAKSARVVITRSLNGSEKYSRIARFRIPRNITIYLTDQLNASVYSVRYKSRLIGKRKSAWSAATSLALSEPNIGNEDYNTLEIGDISESPTDDTLANFSVQENDLIFNTPAGKQACDVFQIDSLLSLVNAARARHAAAPLQLNSKLYFAAFQTAIDISTKGELSHNGWMTHINESGYIWQSLGQNIGVTGSLSPDFIMEIWMKSPGHRANILSTQFSEIGVACMVDEQGDVWWAQNFGAHY